jgi:hypothetical protein
MGSKQKEDLDEIWLWEYEWGLDYAITESKTFMLEFNPETATWHSSEITTPEDKLSKSIKDELLK